MQRDTSTYNLANVENLFFRMSVTMRRAELVIDEIETQKGQDTSTRWEMHVAAGLYRYESGSQLLPLFYVWETARGAEALPNTESFNPASIASGYNASVVSMRESGFRLMRHGVMALDWKRGFVNANERLWLEQDLFSVKLRELPAYHHIDQKIGGVRRRFSRLLLPIGVGSVQYIFIAENNDIVSVAVSSAD